MSGEAPEGIDSGAIEEWFAANVAGAEPPLEFERISGGRSNLTYAVTDSAGRRWALRRPPLGKRLGSAHDMSREHRVIEALENSDVPVPALAGFSPDDSVNGAPFYVMDFLPGPILRSAKDAEVFDEAQRRAIGERVVDTLVALHEIDPDSVGLGDLGRKEDYVTRQLKRWQGQWEKSKTREVPQVEEVHDRLLERIPEQGPAAIVHGDYRLDNMILADDGRIAAVVDWELCTLGDPLADVGLLTVYWGDPDEQILPNIEPPTAIPGFPARDEIATLYAERSGRDLSQIDFYVALGLWKLAVIAEGVFSRYAAGSYGTAEAGYEQFGKVVVRLAEEAGKAVDRLD
jgi:aminoglycoside phosphotransferase (APT) family kinase protein